jgi:hypothetical protein
VDIQKRHGPPIVNGKKIKKLYYSMPLNSKNTLHRKKEKISGAQRTADLALIVALAVI